MYAAMVFLYAFLGGLILNLMPCVFPVLFLKFASVANSSRRFYNDGHKHAFFMDFVFYSAGVAISMLLLSLIVVSAKYLGYKLGWGFHMQSPLFLLFMVYVTFFLGLAFSGFYSLPSFSYSHSGGVNSFFSSSFWVGCLSAVLATPCSGPLMIYSVSAALLSNMGWFFTVAVFQFLALGMYFPFLLFGFFPRLFAFLPKPGIWMEKLQQFLAFPMYITSIWFFSIVVGRLGASCVAPIMGSVLFGVVSLWLFKQVKRGRIVRFLSCLALLFSLSVPAVSLSGFGLRDLVLSDYGVESVEPKIFSNAKLESELKSGNDVLVAVGADWCITCKLNELVLESSEISDIMRRAGIVYMKADWTTRDSAITSYLEYFNHAGVPLYVLYHGGGSDKDVYVFPQILTPSGVKSKLTLLTKKSIKS